MADFLLELRCEEIPARMQAGARAELEKLFRRELDAAGVSAGDVTIWSTPRRLALIARGLPLATEAVSEEAKGPPEGAPDAAIDGFCKKAGVSRDQLELRDVKGRMTYFAVVNIPGRPMAEVLAAATPAIIRDFSWPKSMRWGVASISTDSLRWVRPLSGIVALLNGEVIDVEVGGIASARETMGHRFHSSGGISIASADDYAAKLRAAHVIVDHEERQNLIRERAAKVAADAGLRLVADEGLVVENAGLTEWPVPLLGRFDETFLDVPPEVIQLTARVNQKYFVCEGTDGKLANAFVCTANIDPVDPAVVVDGNRKVLAARLSDARFFWEQDQKTPLAVHAEKLSRITFHEKLGTVADKVERVAKLARWLCEEGIVAGDPALAEQAARLCKADLVTEMVGEFPELQGLMGGYYAAKEGLPVEVAEAIRDHYKPVGQGDEVPTAPVTVAVSLADKLDTLRSFFKIDEKPTGSKDPFALRRAALGTIRLITDNGLRMGVAEGDLLDFFADRLKVQQREAGVRHDLIDAVFALGQETGNVEDDLVRLLARVHALQAFVTTEDGTNLLAGYKRAANILKKEGWDSTSRLPGLDPGPRSLAVEEEAGSRLGGREDESLVLSYTPEPAEKALIDALDTAAPLAAQAVEAERFADAMAALATLRVPIDRFFEEVTVNAQEADKRQARLALLARFRDAVHRVADFSRIEG
ncbi:glycine--tRNA ligase subunit beta [Erythrobacter dokdonensis]|uniref:Glycine--tRNA ligase beta subunit n=1 Tax=Erythrobacter dokdonensis DSW-74 TaxID=1300349 RepID=A0A1A7BME7_9SPHN|nr:glycine--tRNA ligase subunit beta [Erythrobacter dokdonensis]OBV12647.1 Glycine--tRNA ligase beta subunit [Erythrobacter dokdonensis DSW-74]